jgi:hypothetical protein
LEGLDQYWGKHDAKALDAFHSVTRLKRYVKPWTLLSEYVEQSTTLGAEIERRRKEKTGPAPTLAEKDAYVDYWIGRLKEINGVMPGQPASPLMWYALIVRFRLASPSRPPYPHFATDKLRETGLVALPRLLNVLEDKTPTRTVVWWRDFYPVRGVISVGSAARQVAQVICDDYGLVRPKFLKEKPDRSFDPITPALRAEFALWFSKIPPGREKLSKEARQQFVEEQRQYEVGVSGPGWDLPD